jgi:NAD(P)H-dependent flavin oxidoreductase YrpB (nitropropane dioxygenase family)
MLEATDEDAVHTRIYTGKPNRTLKNKYMDRWQHPDAPQTLPMPFQNLYSPFPQQASTEHSMPIFNTRLELRDWVSTPAGNVVGLIKQRKSARQILYDMLSQASDILGA